MYLSKLHFLFLREEMTLVRGIELERLAFTKLLRVLEFQQIRFVEMFLGRWISRPR